MNRESMIQTIREPKQVFQEHIAAITGQRYVRRPHYYRNMKNGDEYYVIVGGFSFPTLRIPGFATIVAAIKDDTNIEAPVLKVVDEIEEQDLGALLAAWHNLRDRWGYPDQLNFLYGDPARYQQTLIDFNQKYEIKKTGGIYLTPPAYWEDQRHTEIYLQTIMSLLLPAPSGKRLVLGESKRTRAHLQSLPLDVQCIEDFPSVAALGYAVHSLESEKPWLQFTQPEQSIPTITDAYSEVYGTWDYIMDEEDGTDYDGGLISTL